jgi:hypothetical protein
VPMGNRIPTFRSLKISTLRCLETSEFDYPLSQRHIPEEKSWFKWHTSNTIMPTLIIKLLKQETDAQRYFGINLEICSLRIDV